jgi:hypothetical protein
MSRSPLIYNQNRAHAIEAENREKSKPKGYNSTGNHGYNEI